MYAVSAANGSRLWSFGINPEFNVEFTPAVTADGGTVIFGGTDNNLVALDARSGAQRWVFSGTPRGLAMQQGFNWGNAVVLQSRGLVLAGCGDYFLYALNVSTGAAVWRYETGGPVYSYLAVSDDDTVFFGSADNYVYALSPEGTLRWRFAGRAEGAANRLGFSAGGPLLSANGVLLVGGNDRVFYALSAHTGALLFAFDTDAVSPAGVGGTGFQSVPVIAPDGTVLVVGENAVVYAFAVAPLLPPPPAPVLFGPGAIAGLVVAGACATLLLGWGVCVHVRRVRGRRAGAGLAAVQYASVAATDDDDCSGSSGGLGGARALSLNR